MPCQYFEITDVFGNEPDADGMPRSVTVKGVAVMDCDEVEQVDVWLAVPDGGRTAAVAAVFGLSSSGERTPDWIALLHDLSDPGDPEEKGLVRCRKSAFEACAELTLDGSVLQEDRRLYDFLFCCPWTVELEVARPDGAPVGGGGPVYADLEPGPYVVRVVSPAEAPDAPVLAYAWYVDDHLRTGEEESQLYYQLEEGSHAIRVQVSQAGCDPVPGTVTLAAAAPLACPETVRIIERSISAACTDGRREVTLEGVLTGAGAGMRAAWEFGDGGSVEVMAIGAGDIDAGGVATLRAVHGYAAPGDYPVELYLLDADGNRAGACPDAGHELRLKPCEPSGGGGGGDQGGGGEGGDEGGGCWLALLFMALGLFAVFTFLVYSPCVPYLLIGSLVGLVVLVVAVIIAAIACDRCRIFRALAWAIWWAIFLGGLPGLLGCPPGAVPVITVLAVLQAVVIAAINHIEGCRVPVPWEFPFCRRVNRRF